MRASKLRHYLLFYACDAWLAWGLPVALTALWLQRTGGFPAKA